MHMLMVAMVLEPADFSRITIFFLSLSLGDLSDLAVNRFATLLCIMKVHYSNPAT